jgi:cell volume regulation protein A
MISIEIAMLALSVLLGVSILASKVSDRVGVPALLLFLMVGMLAGSEGFGGIEFDNAAVAQAIGIVALAVILFSGGLDTDWASIRPIAGIGIILAILGVALTAGVVGLATIHLTGFSVPEGLLLGAIVSSTDAAAVFSILRSRGVSLKGDLRPLLEFESGSNDPMAVFLTLGMIQWVLTPEVSLLSFFPLFLTQMGLGAALGYAIGRLAVPLFNHVRLGVDGLYPVLGLAVAFLSYSLTATFGGSGFLAVYITGLVLGNRDFVHRGSLLRFCDGLAWLMQITMFLTLGLLVFPSRLIEVAVPGLLLSVTLILLARPAGVLACTLFTRLRWNERLFVSWVGLRGAVPIILATFPYLAGVTRADIIFNLVFFVVLTSVLIQGPSIPLAARRLRVDAPVQSQPTFPIEPNPAGGFRRKLRELELPAGSPFAGRAVVELSLPREFLIVLVGRGDSFLIPTGSTELQAGDRLLVIADDAAFAQMKEAAQAPLGASGES